MDQPISEKDLDTLVNLILVACQDEEVKSELITILEFPWNLRNSFLNRFVQKMKQQNASQDFIQAIDVLKKETVANQILEILAQ